MNNSLRRIGKPSKLNLNKVISFSFDGKTYKGFEGDTIASALIANGVKILGRSFKLHRPRSVISSGIEEPNGLVELNSGALLEPNARATLIKIKEGLTVTSQNAWPNVQYDFLGILDRFNSLLPASFYYKSMMWPSWPFFEKIVRKLAGLGRASTQEDPSNYIQRNIHTELLIVGAGPAGLATAVAAIDSGKSILIVDQHDCLGGSLNYYKSYVGDSSSDAWLSDQVKRLRDSNNVTVLLNTLVTGYFENNFLCATEKLNYTSGSNLKDTPPRERLWKIRASQVVLATGAIERPLVFPNNDKPGIMLSNSVLDYCVNFGVKCGEKLVIFTNNDSVYSVIGQLNELGLDIVAVIDSRKEVSDVITNQLRKLEIPIYLGSLVSNASGYRRLKYVEISEHLGNGNAGNFNKRINCDVLAMSGGWTPTIHLYSQASGKLKYDESSCAFIPSKCAQDVYAVGSASGVFDVGASVKQATDAVLLSDQNTETFTSDNQNTLNIEPYWYIKNKPTNKQWLDYQYDVKVSDIELANIENYRSIEHVKRYTTNGMSIDQGKTSNVNAIAVMAHLSDCRIPEVGTTKFRPPFHPMTVGTIANRNIGENYSPIRRLAVHKWHEAHNAKFTDYGWLRPECYPKDNEAEDEAIRREVLAVRNNIGIFDNSPIGKIEVRGKDAAEFLNRIYINNVLTLKDNHARYGLMLNENGNVIDDGIFIRINEAHFIVHTTSNAANRISLMMEEWLQCEWVDLNVAITDVTSQWSTFTISGPNTKKLLEQIDTNLQLVDSTFKHMNFIEGEICGINARVLRASFSGEISYELSVPTRYALSFWHYLIDIGEDFNMTPYGVESLMVLRCEKGYLHVGADTDGTTNPIDLGWANAISKKTYDFIGKRSLSRSHDVKDGRLQFVGLAATNNNDALQVGGHVLTQATQTFPIPTEGYCTSACMSPTLTKSVGLGLVKNGFNRIGETVYVYSNGEFKKAQIVSPTHYDPDGERLT